jgi:hypothetical protein
MANSKVALLRYIRIARGWRRVRVEAIRRSRGWDERIGAPEGAEILERGEFQLRWYRGSNDRDFLRACTRIYLMRFQPVIPALDWPALRVFRGV